MKKIRLTKGKSATVDDEDYQKLRKHRWYFTSHGYAERDKRISGSPKKLRFFMHKIIMNTPDNFDTDHINGDRLDNRKENLRICLRSENLMNQRKTSSKTSSRYKGVSWNKKSNKWEVSIKVNYKKHYIGSFLLEYEAAKAYNCAAINLHGKFSKINSI